MLILHNLTGIFYLLSSLGYLFQIIFSERRMERVTLCLLSLGVLCHSLLLFVHVTQAPYPFILGEGDFLYFTSWVIAVTFLLLRWKYAFSAGGAFFVPLALLFFILAEVLWGESPLRVVALGNPWALVHIVFMSLAFAIFTISFLVGNLYLFQRYQLKNRKVGLLMNWLPSLEAMDGIHYKALTVGFVLLSVGMLAGALLSKTTIGHFFSADPRQVASVVTWLLYALFLNVRMNSGWRGKKGIILSLLGFIGVILTFLGLEHH